MSNRSLRAFVLLLFLAIVAAGCAPAVAPTPAPAAMPASPSQPAASHKVTYNEVSFAYPAALAVGATGITAPVSPGPGGGPWWAWWPEHTEIGLSGYVLQKTLYAPTVFVYPVEEFVSISDEAARQIKLLRDLLQKRPDDAAEMPFLPLINGVEQLHLQVRYLSFAGGQGVRYVAQHGQGPNPVNNHDLFYTFQGLTTDGKYYVSAVLPVSHGTLPSDLYDLPQVRRTAIVEEITGDWKRYIEDTKKALAAQPDTSFKPALGELDRLVETIAVMP